MAKTDIRQLFSWNIFKALKDANAPSSSNVFATMADLTAGGGTFSLPIVRYVYLVEDPSDAVLMGDAASNVYITAQDAYNAAVVLQGITGAKVVILVGNTTSGTGGIVLTANYNSNVVWVGLNGDNGTNSPSVIGSISATTFTLNARFANMKVGNISATTAAVTLNALNCDFGTIATTTGAVGITLNDCTTGTVSTTTGNVTMNLNTTTVGNTTTTTGGSVTVQFSRDSTVGVITTSTTTANASGSVTLTACSSMTFSGITQNASAASVGALSFNQCFDTVIGALTRNQTTATANAFVIGAITFTNCDSMNFIGITSSIALATSTGSIAGISCNNTNRNIKFSGNIAINGMTTNAASDVAITSIIMFNVTVDGTFHINGTGVSGTYATTIRGGKVTTLTIDNCIFNGVFSIGYHTINNNAAGTVSLTNSQFNSGASFGCRFMWNKTTLTSFTMRNCVAATTTTGFTMFPENTGTSTAFVQQMVFDNNRYTNIVLGSLASTAGTEAVPNYLITNCRASGVLNSINMYVTTENAKLVGCQFPGGIDFANASGASAVNSFIYGCSHVHLIDNIGQVTLTVKATYLTGALVNATSYAFLAYGSTLDFVVNGLGTTYTITGTLWTSTLVKNAAATDSTSLQNSITQSI